MKSLTLEKGSIMDNQVVKQTIDELVEQIEDSELLDLYLRLLKRELKKDNPQQDFFATSDEEEQGYIVEITPEGELFYQHLLEYLYTHNSIRIADQKTNHKDLFTNYCFYSWRLSPRIKAIIVYAFFIF